MRVPRWPRRRAERLAASRAIADRYALGEEPIDDSDTGLGGHLRHRIDSAESAEFRTRMVCGRTTGVAERLIELVEGSGLPAALRAAVPVLPPHRASGRGGGLG